MWRTLTQLTDSYFLLLATATTISSYSLTATASYSPQPHSAQTLCDHRRRTPPQSATPSGDSLYGTYAPLVRGSSGRSYRGALGNPTVDPHWRGTQLRGRPGRCGALAALRLLPHSRCTLLFPKPLVRFMCSLPHASQYELLLQEETASTSLCAATIAPTI